MVRVPPEMHRALAISAAEEGARMLLGQPRNGFRSVRVSTT